MSLRVFPAENKGVPQRVTFAFSHFGDCPPESPLQTAGQNDNPFEGHAGPAVSWDLVEAFETITPPPPAPALTISYWKVEGADPEVTLRSKVGQQGETWHFAIYLEVYPEPDQPPGRTYCFDPELVVDPW